MDPNTRLNPATGLDPDTRLNPDTRLDPEQRLNPESHLKPETKLAGETELHGETGLHDETGLALDPPNPAATSPAAASPACQVPKPEPPGWRHQSGGAGAAQLPLVNSFRERFEALLPRIQEQWPSVARHSLEASRGSLEEVAAVIASQTGRTATVVQEQLLELLQVAGEQTARLADGLEPLEQQLQRLLDELDATLRPRLEAPVRQRPLLAVGLAAGVGLLVGMLLSSRRR
ncbi:MAG TPA: hypothetical protein DDY43_02045 [Synechococcales bacterium UBA10510]|nr:hypothetical protein [Synechococcales bacterium UBA10510]